MKNRNTVFLISLLALGLFALRPMAQAVTPPLTPDPGPKPVSNTADGQNALLSITTGIHNTAIGFDALLSNTDANFNTAVGSVTLLLNNGAENTAVGAGALLSNTAGTDNTANGAFALFSNTASGNTAVGARTLLSNTTGGTLENIAGLDVGPNVAVGWQALESNTVASANTAVGYQALQSFTTGPVGFEHLGACTAVGFQALANGNGGFGNSAFGYQALFNNNDGSVNTAMGQEALFSNSTGGGNTAAGEGTLFSNTTGSNNTAAGVLALQNNTSGNENTAVGDSAMNLNTIGLENTAVGDAALFANTIGTSNTAIGFGALGQNSSGQSNVALGASAGTAVTTANNVICIGANVFGADVNNSCYIGNIWNQSSSGGAAVFVNADGKLGTTVSSRRFKENIKPIDKASEAILALQPVTFRYKKEFDPTGTTQFGLVAEEVEKVNPDLVVHDKDGKPYTVRYDQVNAMLLNEFLKEHRRVEEQACEMQEQRSTIIQLKTSVERQEATIAQREKAFQSRLEEQEKQIIALTSGLQKVSAQVEVSKPGPRMAVNTDTNFTNSH